MNAIEALRHHTGRDLTETQAAQAERYGGLNDPRTIASIPEQIEVFAAWFHEATGLAVRNAPATLAPVVSLNSWAGAQKQMQDRDRVLPLILNALGIKPTMFDLVEVPAPALDRFTDAELAQELIRRGNRRGRRLRWFLK